MANIVLVHGGWHGGWCYRRVAKILRAAGHEVYTPTLTGLGERSHLLRADTDLDTHIADVQNVIRWEELDDVVLCGHSYGGFVVTGVADAIPDKLKAVVYLDAFVPQDGDSVMGFMDAQRKAAMLQDAQANGGMAVTPPDVAIYHVNAADKAWVQSMLTPHPLAALLQPIRLKNTHRHPRRIYVYAKGRTGSAPFYEQCLLDPAWTVLVTVDGGHDQMIDDPETVARILMDAAS